MAAASQKRILGYGTCWTTQKVNNSKDNKNHSSLARDSMRMEARLILCDDRLAYSRCSEWIAYGVNLVLGHQCELY